MGAARQAPFLSAVIGMPDRVSWVSHLSSVVWTLAKENRIHSSSPVSEGRYLLVSRVYPSSACQRVSKLPYQEQEQVQSTDFSD